MNFYIFICVCCWSVTIKGFDNYFTLFKCTVYLNVRVIKGLTPTSISPYLNVLSNNTRRVQGPFKLKLRNDPY